MITAKIIADSVNDVGNRITTFVCTYPRFIHSEVMTHRTFSRNASSSRAIPITKMIETIEKEPAMPIHWGKNQKGMQAEAQIAPVDQDRARDTWLMAMKSAIEYANVLSAMGVHKQVVNRLLEPYSHMTTIITATEWGNFFNLRAHKDAQPEFKELAVQMLKASMNSGPVYKKSGEWHLPFSDQYFGVMPIDQMLKITTARCARVSYLTFDGVIDSQKDFQLHDQLKESGHWSPFEHAACSLSSSDFSGNFRGWKQYRKLFTDENKQNYNPNQLLKDQDAS